MDVITVLSFYSDDVDLGYITTTSKDRFFKRLRLLRDYIQLLTLTTVIIVVIVILKRNDFIYFMGFVQFSELLWYGGVTASCWLLLAHPTDVHSVSYTPN